MNDRLFLSTLRLLPKNALSRGVGALTRWRLPQGVRLAAMRAFARRYGIDLGECPDLEAYRTFGEFFARPLRPGLRPIAPGDDVVVSPVDGTVSEAGVATGGTLVQAKGISYPAAALLADG
jgi:phosphatidylserine decarboxylase